MTKLFDTFQDLAPLAGRILIATIFIIAGFNKIEGYDATAGWMDAMGVPGSLLPLVILTEIAGGIAIVLGFQTRLVALLLAGFTVSSALIFHTDLANQTEFLMFFKNMAIAGGFLFLVAYGGGAWSIDNWQAYHAAA